MKGWIKVHGYLKHDERFIKASAITTVGSGVRADDETDTVTCLILDGDGTPYGVTEPVEEVLALIEEAEKPWYVKAKEECEKRVDGCVGCPITSICNETPRTWGLDSIPEEYR